MSPRAALFALIMPLVSTACFTSRPIAPPLPDWYRNNFSDSYYPRFSVQTKEVGEIIVQFKIGADGVIEEPIAVNEEKSAHFPRLIEATRRLLHRAKFVVGDRYKKTLTASVVFEVAPCGTIQHSAGADYNLNLCMDPMPIPGGITP